MKKFIAFIALTFVAIVANAQTYTYVNGYTRSNGTYVQGHYRTTPNATTNDNWSTIGNTNPFTGTPGTKPASYYSSSSSYSYSTPSYSSYSYSTPSYTYSTPTYSTTSYYSTPSYSTYTAPSYSTSTYSSSTSVYSAYSSSTYIVSIAWPH